MRAGVAGFAKFIRNDRAESIVYGLLEARASGETGRHLAFQCAAARARGATTLLTPHILPVGSKVILLGEEENSFFELSFSGSWEFEVGIWIGVVGALDWGRGIEK